MPGPALAPSPFFSMNYSVISVIGPSRPPSIAAGSGGGKACGIELLSLLQKGLIDSLHGGTGILAGQFETDRNVCPTDFRNLDLIILPDP